MASRHREAFDATPVWQRLSVHQIGDRWAAMLLADEQLPPDAGTLKELAFFRALPEMSVDAGSS